MFHLATGKSSVYDGLRANEKRNFKVLYDAVWQLGGVPMMLKMDDMTGQIPDEKVCTNNSYWEYDSSTFSLLEI